MCFQVKVDQLYYEVKQNKEKKKRLPLFKSMQQNEND